MVLAAIPPCGGGCLGNYRKACRMIDIMNMPAGIDMDILIVTRVMGFMRLPPPAMPALQKPTANGIVELYDCPRYSTDIAAAWEVVEEMKKRVIYKYPVCPNIVYHHSDNLWWCEFFSGDWMRNASADTAPLAICRAGLLAVGVK